MQNKSSLLVLINRAARKAGSFDSLTGVKNTLAKDYSPKYIYLENNGLTEQLLENTEAKAIVIAGGDGTVNQIVNSLSEQLLPIAIIPMGTANDLAKQLNIPNDLIKAASLIKQSRTRKIDIIETNGKKFCTVGGLGITADTALTVNHIKQTSNVLNKLVQFLGSSIYKLIAAVNILLRADIKQAVAIKYYDVATNKETVLDVDIYGLFIANQGTLGASLKLCSSSSNLDGLFEICILPANSRLKLLTVLIKMAKSIPIAAQDLIIIKTPQAQISCEKYNRFFGDGELLCYDKDFQLKIASQSLEVIC